MGKTKNQIENQIEDAREDLGANLQELERKVKSVTDWKQYYAKSPMLMIGVAFGVGVVLAAMSGKKHPGRRFSNSRNAESHEHQKNKGLAAWENIKGALVGVAATRVKDYVSEIVPGFRDHYDRTQRENNALDSGPTMNPQRSV
ncbi:MAG: hypothetical protein ABI806_07765 [Candidatus Solibacter sp.]